MMIKKLKNQRVIDRTLLLTFLILYIMSQNEQQLLQNWPKFNVLVLFHHKLWNKYGNL